MTKKESWIYGLISGIGIVLALLGAYLIDHPIIDKLQKENAELKIEIEQYLNRYPCLVIAKGKWLGNYETYELIDTCKKKIIWLEGGVEKVKTKEQK